jgi:hypothetical protein
MTRAPIKRSFQLAADAANKTSTHLGKKKAVLCGNGFLRRDLNRLKSDHLLRECLPACLFSQANHPFYSSRPEPEDWHDLYLRCRGSDPGCIVRDFEP